MHAELATLRALLKELEWIDYSYHHESQCCPICDQAPPYHDAECRLMAALATEPKP